MVAEQHWMRSDFIDALNERGYHITSKDVTWATKWKLVNPVRIHAQLFAYTEKDMAAMSVFGELKRRGINRSDLEAIISSKSFDLVNALFEHIEENKREGVLTYEDYLRRR